MNKKELIIKELKNIFENTYYCIRTWSAWGYDTMSEDDFVLFIEDETFIEMTECFLSKVNMEQSKITEELVCNILSNYHYDLYYNECLDKRFYKDDFNEDFLDNIDYSDIVSLINTKRA